MALPLKWNATLEYQANHLLDAAERIAEVNYLHFFRLLF